MVSYGLLTENGECRLESEVAALESLSFCRFLGNKIAPYWVNAILLPVLRK